MSLSQFRFTWRTVKLAPVPLTAHEGPLGALTEAGRREYNSRHGVIFKSMRLVCCLDTADVARGWSIYWREVEELEAGLRCFSSTADLWAALNQLWLWQAEALHQGSPPSEAVMGGDYSEADKAELLELIEQADAAGPVYSADELEEELATNLRRDHKLEDDVPW